ncbi:MAG: M10 family metallopeptidase C-terminal domain-containing protein [Paracoccaceae bacterium]
MCVTCVLAGKHPFACGSTQPITQQLTIPADPSTTATISVGGTVDSVLDFEGDKDWFRIDLTAGQTIQVDMFGLDHDPNNGLPELEDPLVRIFAADGNFLAENDDIVSGVERDSRLIFTASEDGTYFIEADAWTDGDLDFAGDYRLTVVATDAPPPPPPGGPVDSIQGRLALNTDDPVLVFFSPAGTPYDYNFGGSRTALADGTNAYEQAQYFSVFEDLETFIDVDFQLTTRRNEADIEIGTAALPTVGGSTLLGFFQLPSSNGNGGGGLINSAGFGYSDAPGGSLDSGGFMYGVAIHEFGHGLGLSHPHEAGAGSVQMEGVTSSSSLGAFDLNQSVFTAMSYNEPWVSGPNGRPRTNDHGYNRTFGALDIAALQAMYGANTSNAEGDDRYSLWTANEQGTGYQAIWDTGGEDEIVHEGTADAVIDLRAATLLYEEGGGGFMSYVDGIYGGFTIANGVVIENAEGGEGDDDIIGNDAANRLAGGSGRDTLNGGDGDDHLIGGTGGDQFYGGGGIDVADYAASSQAVFVTLGGIGTGGDAEGDSLQAIEALIGSEFNDLLTGDEAANTLTGGAGSDVLEGGGGADVLYGGAGFDALEGGAGADSLFGGDSIGDIATYFSATGPLRFVFDPAGDIAAGSSPDLVDDVIGDDIEGFGGASAFANTFDASAVTGLTFFLGGASGDTFFGGSGTDQLIGVGGNDVIYGNDGADGLVGEGGDDDLYGGADADFFFFDEADGADVIHDFNPAIDRILFGGTQVEAITDLVFVTVNSDDTRIDYGAAGQGNSITVLNVEEAALQNALVF